MTRTETLAPPAVTSPLARSLDVIVFGLAVYALFASGLLRGDLFPYGQNIYDEYFLALLDGHLDLPARVVKGEGHYAPDGTAYLYHGAAPLLPRFLLGWIWPFETLPLAPLVIWIWASLGTLCYHAAFLKACSADFGRLGDQGASLTKLVGVAIWFAGPGLLLSASSTFYHEPIALAYAATGGFALLWARVGFDKRPLGHIAIACAGLSALVLHARPNVAIGLYLATVLALLFLAGTSLRQHWLRIGLALAILGAGGLGYLALNSAKFGSLTQTHGSFSKGDVQYGFFFWGAEDTDSARAQAFKQHGKFNARRIPHNLTVYLADPPDLQGNGSPASDRFHTDIRQTLAPGLGFIRIEPPFVGLIFLWPLWLLLAGAAPWASRRSWKRLAIPVIGGLTTTLLTLAYGTVTLRYRVDLWPLIALLALLGLSATAPKLAVPGSMLWKGAAAACLVLGIALTAITASQLRFFQAAAGNTPSWSYEECEALARSKSFSQDDISRICQPPRIGR